MNTYEFTFSGVNYTSNDPTTPVSGAIGFKLTVEAADLESAKTAVAGVFASAGSLEISGIIVIG